MVWEAYQLVRANRGAAGVDDETIAMFEQNLSGNLYKLWNRMSSGSYFPPPVKQVEIPKELLISLLRQNPFNAHMPKRTANSC
jgi:RNA-directed DNA polymerase